MRESNEDNWPFGWHELGEHSGVLSCPLLHIADATAENLVKDGVTTVGLLGTAFTMEQDFYKGRLFDYYGLKVVVPRESDRKMIHEIIYNELCLGNLKDSSRQEVVRMIGELAATGAEAVILGCTEIGMLIGQDDTDVPLYDTTAIHAAKAVEWAVQQGD